MGFGCDPELSIINNIMKFLSKVFDWLWLSSADPSKVGLTAKSFLTVLAGALIPALGLFHVSLGGPEAVNGAIDSIDVLITDVLVVIGALGGALGAIRKVALSISGKNPVISAPSNPNSAIPSA